jgi:2-iminoacetate synthase ThiH
MTTPRDELLTGLGLADLLGPAQEGKPFPRAALERVLAAANPLAAATLADARRRAEGAVEVTHPWTLRVRGPGYAGGVEDATKVSHEMGRLGGIPASEAELLGALPEDAPLALAVELVRSVAAERPDLTLRAFTAREVCRLSARERMPRRDVVATLKSAGLATLTWRAGDGFRADELEAHKAAHEAGVATIVAVGTRHGAVDRAYLDRLAAVAKLAETQRHTLSVVVLPELTDGASPLDGTSGSEDWTAVALARLALGTLVPHVTVDWHVVGHKLGATMLAAGADDVVGTQAAACWAPPTNDGPRPVNPDRARLWIVEARRSPVLRDALFKRLGQPNAAGHSPHCA